MAVDTSPVSQGSQDEPRQPRGGRRLPAERAERSGHVSAGRAMSQFALVGVLVLVLLAGTGLLALRHAAVSEEVAQAQELTVAATRWVAEPALTDGLVTGDKADLAAFSELMREEILTPSKGRVVRLKLWTADGRIVYSDQPLLIGQVFPLPEDELRTLRSDTPDAELSELDAKENKLERKYGQLLQVYARVETPSGQPLLFESYLRMDSVLAGSGKLIWSIVPAFMLALLALQVLQLPLAWRLVRRIQLGQREKAALQRRALEASDHERRRIARDLHDGLVQSLVGVSYSLAGTADRARAGGQQDTAAQLDAAAATTRSGVAQLRSLITDIYPPSLESEGLRASLVELLAIAEKQGLQTSLDMGAEPRVAPEITATLYRAAQESVRNVLAHARANSVHVQVVQGPRTVGVIVDDDGVGPTAVPPDPDRAHFGLRLLEDLTREVGGRLEVSPGPHGGTRFTFMLPSR